MREKETNHKIYQLSTGKFFIIVFSQFVFAVIGFLIFGSALLSGALGDGSFGYSDYGNLFILFGAGAAVSILGSILVWIVAYIKIYKKHSRRVVLMIISSVIPIIALSFFVYAFLVFFVFRI